MDLGIKGKRALVLASSKGLGHGIAVALAREGANVLLCGRSGERLEANCKAINAEGKGRVQDGVFRAPKQGRDKLHIEMLHGRVPPLTAEPKQILPSLTGRLCKMRDEGRSFPFG